MKSIYKTSHLNKKMVVNKDYPEGIVVYKMRLDIYGVITPREEAKRYSLRKGASEEEFDKIINEDNEGNALLYLPGMEVHNNSRIPFRFSPNEFAGWVKTDKVELKKRAQYIMRENKAQLEKVLEFL